MRNSQAYVSLGKDGAVTGVCIIVDDRQSGQALRSLQRSNPEASIAKMSVTRALKLMRKREIAAPIEARPKSNAARRHFLRQGSI
jgi:hypothetical protein